MRGRAGLTGSMALIQSSSPGVVIEDTEVVADFPSYYVDGFVGHNVVLRRVNMHGVVDQVKIIGDNVLVEDAWLHDNLYYASVPSGGDTHSDNVQVQAGRNITVRRTVMRGARNAVLQVTQDRGPVGDLRFVENDVDGGSYPINIAEKSHGPIRGLAVTDNLFGFGTATPRRGIIAPLTTSSISDIARNKYPDGSPVPIKRG